MLQLKFLNLKVETAQKDTALAYTVQCGYPTVKTALLRGRFPVLFCRIAKMALYLQ